MGDIGEDGHGGWTWGGWTGRGRTLRIRGHIAAGNTSFKKVQKKLGLRYFMIPILYRSRKIPLVFSQAANPLCSSTVKYTKEILKNTKEK